MSRGRLARAPHGRTARRLAAAGSAVFVLLAAPSGLRAQAPPAPPENLEAEVDEDEVELEWDAGEAHNRREALVFRVYRDGSSIGTSTDEDFTDRDVQSGRTYQYQVSGIDVLGREGERSASLSVTIPGGQPPARPQNLTADAVSPSAIDLRWDPVAGGTDDDDDDDDGDELQDIDFYRVYRDGSVVGTTSGPEHRDTGLEAFTEYVYRVSAVTRAGVEGERSAPASARTQDGSAPSRPENLTADAVSSSRIELDWDAAGDPESGIRHYYVYRDGAAAPRDSTTSTGYADTNVSGAQERTYEVAAVNNAGLVGPRSNAATARPPDGSPPGPPGDLVAEAVNPRLIELDWDAASDAESGIDIYLVYRDGGSSPIDSTTSTSFQDRSVRPETTYGYTVSARNGEGLEGPRSSAAQATTPAATDATPPSEPGNLAAEAAGPSRVELSWSAAEDAESGVSTYRVYRDDDPLGSSPGGGFTDLTVQPETTYEYEVAAVNGDGLEGPRARAAPVTTPAEGGEPDTVPPAPPTGLRVITE